MPKKKVISQPTTYKSRLKKILAHKQVNLMIKLLIVVLVVGVLYRQVFARDNIDELWLAFRQNFSYQQLPWLLCVVVLMPVNWILENFKWRLLIRRFTRLHFGESFKAIWAGVALSIFTPNQMGAYGGRILFVKPENNLKAIIATMVGSLSQMLVVIAMGLMGLIYFSSHFLDIDGYFISSLYFMGLSMVALLGFGFFNVDLIIPLAGRLPYIRRWKRLIGDLALLKSYDNKVLSQALAFALLRYLTYSIQYFLLLHFFGIEVPALAAFAGIATIYLVMTSLPITPLLGILARVEIALLIWGIFSDNELSILACTFCLWIINVIVPALIGTAFITNVNVLKSLGYESKEN